VGVPDAKAGEAVKLVIVKKDQAVTEADVRAYCEVNFTGYKTAQRSSSSAPTYPSRPSGKFCVGSCETRFDGFDRLLGAGLSANAEPDPRMDDVRVCFGVDCGTLVVFNGVKPGCCEWSCCPIDH
jgi:hypothetical protein